MEPYSECLKIVVDLQSKQGIGSLQEVPNTFNSVLQQYVWKEFEGMDYAIIPRELEKDVARVDLFIEMDEDDLDDIDLPRFLPQFISDEVLNRIPEGKPQLSIKWISEPEEWVAPADVRHTGLQTNSVETPSRNTPRTTGR